LQSIIRREMLGPQFDAPPTGMSAFRWVMPAETIKEHPEHSWILANGPTMVEGKGLSFIFSYPCRSKTLLNVAAFHQDERDQHDAGMYVV
jgi:hypothetical protein